MFTYHKFNINYIIYLIVLDSQHKMQYYKDNNFEDVYIDIYKDQIIVLWIITYKPSSNESNINQFNTEQNALTLHMSRKHRVIYDNKLKAYLNKPPISFDMDVLTFWKVKLMAYL